MKILLVFQISTEELRKMFQVSMLKYILLVLIYHCCAVITDTHVVARVDDTLTGFPSCLLQNNC